MMMAHDSSPPSHPLDAATLDALRRALLRYADAPGRDGELRAALCALAAEARTRQMPPEQLLITLKNVWNALPEVQRLSEPAEKTRILQRIVTMCIKEYYGA